jgi:hypothetical protein
MIPDLFRHREVEDDCTFDRLARLDQRVAQKRRRDKGLEGGKSCEEVLKILLLDGTGLDLVTISSLQSCSHILDKEREVQPVFHMQGGHHIKIVLGTIPPDNDSVGFEDRVGGIHGGIQDFKFRRAGGGIAEDESKCYSQYQKGDQNRD